MFCNALPSIEISLAFSAPVAIKTASKFSEISFATVSFETKVFKTNSTPRFLITSAFLITLPFSGNHNVFLVASSNQGCTDSLRITEEVGFDE